MDKRIPAILTILAFGATAWAETDVVDACVNQSGLTRIVSSASLCNNSETALSWPSLARVQALATRVATLEGTVAAQAIQISVQASLIAGQAAEIAALEQALASEVQERAAGDASLASVDEALAGEDATLQASIASEAAARAAEDDALQDQIDNLPTGGIGDIVVARSAVNNTNMVEATCPDPEHQVLLAGGGDIVSTHDSDWEPVLVQSTPNAYGNAPAEAWVARSQLVFARDSGSDAFPSWSIYAYAVCGTVN